VETNIGMIDARLEVQLESLRARLHRALNESEAENRAVKEKDEGEGE
jgi:flagellar biosynthesis/type III secretory pathway protein FliH